MVEGDTLKESSASFRYEITGSVAHQRICPLLPEGCIENDANVTNDPPDFLWENAPRRSTRSYRDKVKCYSHLPNGTAILDCKWVLARLLGSHTITSTEENASSADKEQGRLATLETHCFRGISGFCSFADSVRLQNKPERSSSSPSYDLVWKTTTTTDTAADSPSSTASETEKSSSPGLWVVKDALSNGAGGVWVVGAENYEQFRNKSTSPLYKGHKYVAQQYTWPMVLYEGRKSHVRVYGLFTSDRRAFVHRRCFLHVANDLFTVTGSDDEYETSVHITNCCANSHDSSKFTGEILADLQAHDKACEQASGETVFALGAFFPSICASVAALARRTFPFLQGGQANNGFEYLGMDFILSYSNNIPIAYLLEVNAPPSQDTATGLPHAEELHNSVIRDILSLWVLPKVSDGLYAEEPGGWRCVHQENLLDKSPLNTAELIAPSKAALLNKIRWTLFERKVERLQDGSPSSTTEFRDNKQDATGPLSLETPDRVAAYARSYFPFFKESSSSLSELPAFFENAGGSQVPVQVIDMVCSSLHHRHRAVIGHNSKEVARDVLRTILGATHSAHDVFLGPNASSLLCSLSDLYVRSGLLKRLDEIVISSENHVANVNPWLEAAEQIGATVKWWTPASAPLSPLDDTDDSRSPNLTELLSPKTRLVIVPHASNILGQAHDLCDVRQIVNETTKGAGHIVVDGVASAPHYYSAVDELDVDWYVVSCHKLFGPHLGALCGKKSVTDKFRSLDKTQTDRLEIGTVSYEACAGVRGLGQYLTQLSTYSKMDPDDLLTGSGTIDDNGQETFNPCRAQEYPTPNHTVLTTDQVCEAYRLMRIVEEPITSLLIKQLERSTKVRILENKRTSNVTMRLPVVSFVHRDITSQLIAETCNKAGIACRSGTFLCTNLLLDDYEVDRNDGVVRFSLSHYSTIFEVSRAMQVLESIPGWF